MISVKLRRNAQDQIYAFEILDHGRDVVCAAVSVLSLNTVNAIEDLTDEKFTCDYDQAGGRLQFALTAGPFGECGHDALLLIEAMVMGLRGIQEEYTRQIEIVEVRQR